MHGTLCGRLEDLERLLLGLKFSVRRKDRRMVASRYVGIKGRWHFKARETGGNRIRFDFHWDWLVHLAYVFGSDHIRKPVVYYRHFLLPRLSKFRLRVVKLDVKFKASK
jgi:hypothetical protein